MPKLKTRKTLLRRIKISRNGKVTKRKVGLKHLMFNKATGQKQRSKGGSAFTNVKIVSRFKKMLGKYGKKL